MICLLGISQSSDRRNDEIIKPALWLLPGSCGSQYPKIRDPSCEALGAFVLDHSIQMSEEKIWETQLWGYMLIFQPVWLYFLIDKNQYTSKDVHSQINLGVSGNDQVIKPSIQSQSGPLGSPSPIVLSFWKESILSQLPVWLMLFQTEIASSYMTLTPGEAGTAPILGLQSADPGGFSSPPATGSGHFSEPIFLKSFCLGYWHSPLEVFLSAIQKGWGWVPWENGIWRKQPCDSWEFSSHYSGPRK